MNMSRRIELSTDRFMDHEFNLDGHVGGFCRAIVRGEVDCLSQHGLGGVGVDDDVGVPGGVLSRQSSHPNKRFDAFWILY